MNRITATGTLTVVPVTDGLVAVYGVEVWSEPLLRFNELDRGLVDGVLLRAARGCQRRSGWGAFHAALDVACTGAVAGVVGAATASRGCEPASARAGGCGALVTDASRGRSRLHAALDIARARAVARVVGAAAAGSGGETTGAGASGGGAITADAGRWLHAALYVARTGTVAGIISAAATDCGCMSAGPGSSWCGALVANSCGLDAALR